MKSRNLFLAFITLILLGFFNSCTQEILEKGSDLGTAIAETPHLYFDKVCDDLEKMGATEIPFVSLKSTDPGFSNYSSIRAFAINGQTHVIYGWDSPENPYYQSASSYCNRDYETKTDKETGITVHVCSKEGSTCSISATSDGGVIIIVCGEMSV